MDAWERDYHTSRIISGRWRIKIGDTPYLLASPSREHRYLANEIYREIFHEAHLEGVMVDEDVERIMRKRKVWTDHDQDQLNQLTKLIEDMKVGLYENLSQSNARLAIRHALEKGRVEHARLFNLRHSLSHMTCEGVAASAKSRFLTGCSLLLMCGTAYWPNPEVCWRRPDTILDTVMDYIARNRLGEAEIRCLARSEPWRSVWSASKHAGRGVFDLPSCDLGEEQQALILWSSIYDSIKEHPDCPSDDVMNDDDMLDGWMILKRREREADQAKKQGEDVLGNEKIRNADEVFIVANQNRTVEDVAKMTGALNDGVAKHIRAERLAHLKRHGEVHEIHMPDTLQRLQMEWASMESDKRMGRR